MMEKVGSYYNQRRGVEFQKLVFKVDGEQGQQHGREDGSGDLGCLA